MPRKLPAKATPGKAAPATDAWTAQRSSALYNVPAWSEGYFSVGKNGEMLAHPRRQHGPAISLASLAARLPDEEGLELPVLLRFTDILKDRVDALTGAFAGVREELGYAAPYTAVYPIKVNQQRRVVEAIVAHGGARVGLEAGSKPELAAVLGLARPGSLIVCNGYKDRAYIRRALIGQKLGHTVYIVVEKLSELPLVITEAADLGVSPVIGLRVRLSGISESTQQNTGGEKAKFGLATPQLLEAVRMMREAGHAEAVRMVHFHLGSQVANVTDIARGMREAARFYIELRKLGAPIDTLDVGGGLGVDYEGTGTRSYCSINYTLTEYARTILQTLKTVCAEAGQPVPAVISESGRALTAHHAVLIADVVDSELRGVAPPTPLDGGPTTPAVLQELAAVLAGRAGRGPLERLHEAAAAFAEAQAAYTSGALSLVERSWAEQAYYAICQRVAESDLDPTIRAHREAADDLRTRLAAKYFCNFSIFQSTPDAWAIDQVFPIAPIHRLDEAPSLRAMLCDLTCDSDGRINSYVDREGLQPTLAVHALKEAAADGREKPYWLGFFMVGAYQEILGDMHNLFGDTNAINVVLDADAPDGWRLDEPEHGDRTDELLRYVHVPPDMLAQTYRRKLAAAGLPEAERTRLLAELEAGLTGYTYFLA